MFTHTVSSWYALMQLIKNNPLADVSIGSTSALKRTIVPALNLKRGLYVLSKITGCKRNGIVAL